MSKRQIRNLAFGVEIGSNLTPNQKPSFIQSLLWLRFAVTSSPPGAAGAPYAMLSRYPTVTGTAAATLPTIPAASEARMMIARSPKIWLAWTRAEARRVVGMQVTPNLGAPVDKCWGVDGSRGRRSEELQRERLRCRLATEPAGR